MKLWQQFVSKCISQYVSGRLFAYLVGNAVVLALGLNDHLDKTALPPLLTWLFVLYFGTKGVEWIGNAVGSVTMKPKPSVPS